MNTQEAIDLLEEHKSWCQEINKVEGDVFKRLDKALTHAIEHMKRGVATD